MPSSENNIEKKFVLVSLKIQEIGSPFQEIWWISRSLLVNAGDLTSMIIMSPLKGNLLDKKSTMDTFERHHFP